MAPMTAAVTHTFTLWSAAASGALVSAVWEGLLLTACVALCMRLLPGLTAARRSLIWTAVFLLVAALHFASWHSGSPVAISPAHHETLEVSARWSLVLALVWLALSLRRALGLASSTLRLHGLLRRAQKVTPAQHQALAPYLAHGRRRVELCTSDEVDRPSVVGFLKPRILLPIALLAELQPQELNQIVLHEMEHLRRADDWVNLMQQIGLVLFPLNPALLYVERRLCIERELACDDQVLRTTGAGKAYATCLARLAEYSLTRRGVTLALGAWEKQSELSRRVHRILRGTGVASAAMGSTRSRLVMSGLSVALLAGFTALAHSPQLVRFTPGLNPQPESSSMADAYFAPEAANVQAQPRGRLVKASASISMPQTMAQQPHLVNAVAVQPVRKAGAHSPAPASRIKARAKAAHHAPSSQNWMVLTSWHDAPRQVAVRPAAYAEISVSYAAVPVANGWLIFQL